MKKGQVGNKDDYTSLGALYKCSTHSKGGLELQQ